VNAFEFFTDHFAAYGYLVLFLGVLLESAGVPVPGETAVLAAGFLASPAGDERFHLGAVIAITFLAAVLGDNAGYWVGRRLVGPAFREGRRFLFFNRESLGVAEAYFARYGSWTIFFARFVTGLRVIGAVAAGAANMVWSRFLLANAAGAAVWSVAISLLGYFFGHSWHLVHRFLGWAGVAVLVGLVLALFMVRIWRRRTKSEGMTK
jgi:membrane protein DedA with SNARE-associated domain